MTKVRDWALAGMLAALIPSCSSQTKAAPKPYDPCVEMKKEGENVAGLERDIEALTTARKKASEENDSAKVRSLNAKLEQKAGLMRMDKAALQRTSENCDAEMKSLHRYPETPQHKSEFP
jgi:hypothetical protein